MEHKTHTHSSVTWNRKKTATNRHRIAVYHRVIWVACVYSVPVVFIVSVSSLYWLNGVLTWDNNFNVMRCQFGSEFVLRIKTKPRPIWSDDKYIGQSLRIYLFIFINVNIAVDNGYSARYLLTENWRIARCQCVIVSRICDYIVTSRLETWVCIFFSFFYKFLFFFECNCTLFDDWNIKLNKNWQFNY